MRRLRSEGLTILLVEQNVRLALAVADHVAVLGKGAIVFAGELAEFHRRAEELRGRYLAV
jgi:branched-chain amino acid transport system ATP-binding protein